MDELYACARSPARAVPDREPADQFHGVRSGWLRDPFGHRWSISAPLPAGGGAPATVHEVGYFTVATIDPQKASAFYGAALWVAHRAAGRRRARREHEDPVRDRVRLEARVGARVREGLDHAWVSARRRVARTRVIELGGTAEDITASPSGRACSCRDDQGVPFEIHEPAPGY